MPSERVLVSGAGISGSVLAYWLAKYDYEVVVVERSKVEQKLGQGLEIEEPALDVVKAMGVMEELESRKTGEMGASFVDSEGRVCASFSVMDGFSPTGALEMMRGDLVDILYKAANKSDKVTYRFQTTIRTIQQTQDKVTVTLEDRATKSTTVEEFDYLVAADGAKSHTRDLVLGTPDEIGCFKPVGAQVAYFSVPMEAQDWPNSKIAHFPDRRVAWMRPVGKDAKMSSVHLINVQNEFPALQEANAAGDRLKQREAWAERYAGLGWETPRFMEEMMKTENFYSEELKQVKLPKWSKQRVVFLGDSAWAPTPFTGQGNQLAIIGGWVLAQEMSRNRSTAAFDAYEQRLRTYVEKSQEIPLNGYMPRLVVPQTTFGIILVRRVLLMVSWMVNFAIWTGLISKLPHSKDSGLDLEMEKTEKETVS